MADLAEVLDAVLAHQGISPEVVYACQQKRRTSCGGFDRRLHLLWVTLTHSERLSPQKTVRHLHKYNPIPTFADALIIPSALRQRRGGAALAHERPGRLLLAAPEPPHSGP